MRDLHERKQRANGALRFKLSSASAPQMSCGGATLRLVEAVEAFDDEHEITLEISAEGSSKTVALNPRGAVDLPEGRLKFRHLLSGEGPTGRVEHFASFEWTP